MARVKAYRYNWKVVGARSTIADYRNPVGGLEWLDGVVDTPFGTVSVYSDCGGEGHTSLRMIVGGRCYCEARPRAYSQRGLAIIAHRFARRVVEEAGIPF